MSYHFGHFVPSLVISYLLLYFYLKLFWSFRTQSLHFHTQVISYLESFRTQFSHFVPRYELTYFVSKVGTNDFFIVVFWKCLSKKERIAISYILLKIGTRATYEPQSDQHILMCAQGRHRSASTQSDQYSMSPRYNASH